MSWIVADLIPILFVVWGDMHNILYTSCNPLTLQKRTAKAIPESA